MVKYVCPKCGRDVGTYGSYCCGYKVQTPAGAAVEWTAFKVFFLIIIIPLMLIALVFGGIIIAGQIRSWHDATRTVDTGVVLPLTATNTTIVVSGNGNVTHYITPDGEFRTFYRREVRVIDTNVRSIEHVGRTTFYIKNDNSLWGFGSNSAGTLGTGTGVDVEEPVLIMENVAKLVYRNAHVYAIGTDGVLWVWGVGDFYPVRMMENVVAIQEGSPMPIIQGSDGLLHRLRHSNVPASEGELFRINPFAILDFVGASDRALTDSRTRLFYINGDDTLTKMVRSRSGGRRERIEIAQDVQSLWGVLRAPAQYNMLMIKSDGTLWGFGVNRYGELGDGTRVPRQETPVS